MGLHDDDDLGMEDGDGMDEMEDQLQGSYMGNDEMGESKLTIMFWLYPTAKNFTYLYYVKRTQKFSRNVDIPL